MPYRADFEGRPHNHSAGIVDPDVDMSEHAQRLIADAIHISAPRHIGGDDVRRRADLERNTLQPVDGARGKDETIAATSELARDGSADAGARASDDDDSIHL
jgi:hypothetical protein